MNLRLTVNAEAPLAEGGPILVAAPQGFDALVFDMDSLTWVRVPIIRRRPPNRAEFAEYLAQLGDA